MRYEMEARPGRVLRVGDERYFLARHAGALHAVPDACPHRGGPLSKGACDEKRGIITCPMHGLKTSVRSLLPKALPAVQTGRTMVVVAQRPVEPVEPGGDPVAPVVPEPGTV